MSQDKDLAIIIPANNEAAYIGRCLDALLRQLDAPPFHVIVSANACADRTVDVAQSYVAAFEAEGHQLTVLDAPEPGKTGALNRAETHAGDARRIYLDADVICDAGLIAQTAQALDTDRAVYATGTLQVARAATWFTRQYARFWQRLPFVTHGAVGAGFFAVNAAGRARWGPFPEIISDDTFVRLNFRDDERTEVPACYHWPMIEGARALIRVRRRQDDGVAEIEQLYPDLLANDTKPALTLGRLAGLAARDPVGFGVYLYVHLASRLMRGSKEWTRGR